MVIDVGRSNRGEFPIVGLDGFTVEASGDLFGGKISGGAIGGIIKLDANGNVLDESATEYADTVFYGGIIAGFNFAGTAGAEIRVGFSELGFLSAYLSTELPAGILLDPVSGLSIKDFRGGVAFNSSPLTPPSSPDGLNKAHFKPTTDLTLEKWKVELKKQVVNQAGELSADLQLHRGRARTERAFEPESFSGRERRGSSIRKGVPRERLPDPTRDSVANRHRVGYGPPVAVGT